MKKHRYKIIAQHDGGYLGFRVDNGVYLERFRKLQKVVKFLEKKKIKLTVHFEGLQCLVYCMRVNLSQVKSFRQFFRLYTQLTGENTLSYRRRGRQIDESEFEFMEQKFAYDGETHQGYLDTDFTVEYLTAK